MGGDPLGDDPLGGDPFAAPGAGFAHPIAVPPPPPRRGEDPFDLRDEARPPAPASLDDDDLFKGIAPAEQWRGPSQPDNADAPMHAFAAPKPIPPVNLDDLDIDALLGEEPPGQPTPAPPIAPPRPSRRPRHRPSPQLPRRLRPWPPRRRPLPRRRRPARTPCACSPPSSRAPGCRDSISAATRKRRCARPGTCCAQWSKGCAGC